MDFANRLTEQLRDLFQSMTPGARITAALLLAVVVVSVGFLFKQSTAGPDDFLFGGEPLSNSQIVAIESAIGQADLHDYQIKGNRILVPRATKDLYIAAIASAGAMPQSAMDYMQKALDSGSVFDSRKVKEQRIKAAREKQLAHLITLMPWVSQASVMYDEQNDRGPRPVQRVSATVSVMPQAGEVMDGRRMRNLQAMVAGWHPNLQASNVTVTNLGGENAMEGGLGGEVDADDFEDKYYRTRVKYEQYVHGNIMKVLGHIEGVRVGVNAILDETSQIETLTTKPDPIAVAAVEITESETSEQQTSDGGNRPGLVAQGPGRGREEDAGRTNSNKTTRESSQTNSQIGQSTTRETKVGHVAKEVWASVQVPRAYAVRIWKNRKEQETGTVPEQIDEGDLRNFQEILKTSISSAVKPLLPTLAVGENEYDQVTVDFYDAAPAEEIKAPTIASDLLAYATQYGTTLGMFGLAIASLLMVRSVVKGGSNTDPASSASVGLRLDTSGDAGNPESEETEAARPRLKFKQADSLKDDLSEMVKEDPDAAAAILKGWINAAS